MIMTPSVRTRNVLIITFEKKVNILYIISTEVEQNMCQKNFFNVICYIAKAAAAATTSHTQFFSSTSSSYSSVLLLCYL